MFKVLLSEALAKVGPDANVASVYGAPVFVGNGANWAEIIHSLKARYFLITKDYANAHAEALLGISSAVMVIYYRHIQTRMVPETCTINLR